MAEKSLETAFQEIIDDYVAITTQAIKNASKKVQTDIVNEAKSYLQRYYNNYPKPKQYKRTYRLKRAIIPYYADRSNNNKISIEVGVQYKSSALKGAYKSNSRFHQSGEDWKPISSRDNSPNNGIPEPEWILSNFLQGIHPWAQEDSESTNSLMETFINEKMPSIAEQYVYDELLDMIISRL